MILMNLDGDWVNVQTTVINDSDTIIASYSETILLINIKTKETIALKKDDQDHGRITCIEVLEKNIYLGFGKGVIKICDIPNTKKEMTFTTFKHVKDKDDEDEDQIILCLRVTYDQKYIICALDSKCIKVYDHNSKVVHHNFSNLEDEPKVLAVHPTVHDIFMVAIESDIYVYSIKNKNKQTSLYNFHASKVPEIYLISRKNHCSGFLKEWQALCLCL